MEEFITQFHFLRPWWLLALLIPLIGYFRFFAGLKNVSAWEGVCDRHLLNFLLVRGSSHQRSLIANLLFIGMFGTIVALAGPSWHKQDIKAYAPKNPVLFLLNLSSDMDKTDVTPDRLTRAKFAISDLLKYVGTAQSGLIVYTDEPFLISPLTEDYRVIDNLLQAVDDDIMPENGDKLNRALDYAVKRLQASGYNKGNIVVLASDVGQNFNLALRSSAQAVSEGFNVSVVNVGTENSDKLQKISTKGRGAYVNIVSGISKLGEYLSRTDNQELKESDNKYESWQDCGYYLLIIPLICTLYFFRQGIMVIVLMSFFATTAHAGFFLNNNQEGKRAFDNQDYEQASEKFEIPNWKAASYYRSGKFDEAVKYFNSDLADGLYNQGNALAKNGKFDEALKKYEQSLKINPDNEDAKFNIEYIKQQQQQQSQSKQNQDKNKDQKDSKQQSSGDNNSSEQNQNGSEQTQSQDEQSSQSAQDKSDSGGKGDEEEQQKIQQPQQGKNNSAENQDGGQSREQQSLSPQEKQEETQEQEKAQVAEQKPAEGKPEEYTEVAQAREQQFRDIPEDSGGLLRAFIYKEYLKNRYKDNE